MNIALATILENRGKTNRRNRELAGLEPTFAMLLRDCWITSRNSGIRNLEKSDEAGRVADSGLDHGIAGPVLSQQLREMRRGFDMYPLPAALTEDLANRINDRMFGA